LDEDDNTKLNKNKIKADAKPRADVEPETKEKLVAIVALWDEQSKLNKGIKAAKLELAKLTEEAINNLTDEEVADFLDTKWVIPVCLGIERIMKDTLDALERKLTALAAKYEVSYSEINASLTEAEDALSTLVGQLTGDEWTLKGLNELLNTKEA
jgi:type I restriction enzyme M protein